MRTTFGFVDLTQSPNPDDDDPADPANLVLNGNQNNPIGRGRSTGCTACHVPYRKDGHNTEPVDRTVADNGRQVTTELPFGMRNELGQRFYADRHEIKNTVDTDTCEKCHAFVTRVDFWYKGLAEVENGIPLGRIRSPLRTVASSMSSTTLQKWENGRLLNPGEGVSEDLNNNGELDEGEDANENGALDIPDRLARSESIDGRQPRVVYGGHNGSIRQMDVHFEAGMQCTDCHGVQDIHGDWQHVLPQLGPSRKSSATTATEHLTPPRTSSRLAPTAGATLQKSSPPLTGPGSRRWPTATLFSTRGLKKASRGLCLN